MLRELKLHAGHCLTWYRMATIHAPENGIKKPQIVYYKKLSAFYVCMFVGKLEFTVHAVVGERVRPLSIQAQRKL